MQHRIVSFLPSATEILCELGLEKEILAVTHECDYPQQAKSIPRVIHPSFDPDTLSSAEIDKKIVELTNSNHDIYILDEKVLKNAKPDLIIAQGICDVCSPFTRELNKAVSILGYKPDVLILDPKNLSDILQNILDVGSKVNRENEARELVAKLQKRIQYIKDKKTESRPKVLCIEWLDPLFTAGHWVPEMVEIAGGINGLSTTGEKSRKMKLDEVFSFDPDIIILIPCGFDLKRTISEYEKLYDNKHWRTLRAVKQGEVYAVNASDYFTKPGPRTITGLEILAKIIRPDTFSDITLPKNSLQRLDLE
jgi:iron complex transport system substrate-binding protein